MDERIWRPAACVPVHLERSLRRNTRACWREGRLALALPRGLRGREEARLVELLVWGAVGRVMSPALGGLARRLNEACLQRPLSRVGFHHQSARWGSCTARGCIYLSHRLLVAPAGLVEAVMLHELAHIGCLDHGADFWRALAAADPFCRRRRSELARYGGLWADWWSRRAAELLRHGNARLDPP